MAWQIDEVLKKMKEVSEDMLNTAISKGALHLKDDQVATVSFVFWICFLAERDLEFSISEPWRKLSATIIPDVVEEAKRQLNEHVFGKRKFKPVEEYLKELPTELATNIRGSIAEGYQEKRIKEIDNLPYFADKIQLYEGMFSHNNVASVLWKINSIRNDVSHNRIDTLKYEEVSLYLRQAKEKLLTDYLSAVGNPDHSESSLRKKLNFSPEEEESLDILAKKLLSDI